MADAILRCFTTSPKMLKNSTNTTFSTGIPRKSDYLALLHPIWAISGHCTIPFGQILLNKDITFFHKISWRTDGHDTHFFTALFTTEKWDFGPFFWAKWTGEFMHYLVVTFNLVRDITMRVKNTLKKKYFVIYVAMLEAEQLSQSPPYTNSRLGWVGL